MPYDFSIHFFLLSCDKLKRWDLKKHSKTKEITFPVRDIDGRCLFVARRSITGKRYSYPSNVDKPIYGLYELHRLFKDVNKVYICESMFNCMTLTNQGVPAVALLGTGSEHQYKLLQDLPFRKYVIATDNDEAGNKGAIKLYNALKDYKLLSRLILKDKTKDINDYGYCKSINGYAKEVSF